MATVTRSDIWSYGGGLQSAAIAVLIAQGRLPKPERIVIADPAEKEAQATWDYLRDHIGPLLGTVGLQVEIAPHSLATVGLYAQNGDILMPVYTKDGALPPFCSDKWKRQVVMRWLRRQGYGPQKPVRMWIGISTNEVGRAKPSDMLWCANHYPLLFDVPTTRHNCGEIVRAAGLPDDIRSACWDCPYRRDEEWRRLPPHEMEKAFARDEELRAYDIARGGSGVWLHKSRKPLRDVDFTAPAYDPHNLFGEVGGCDSGMCWT